MCEAGTCFLPSKNEAMKPDKPLGQKAYGSIPHLIGSKTGEGDHTISQGQHNICTIKTRDKHDVIIVQEKFDGSNVAVAKINGQIVALTRPGYLAETSPHEMHHIFANWVKEREDIFQQYLNEGERLCGELMLMAHGLKYKIDEDNPIIWFDLMRGMDRVSVDILFERIFYSGLLLPVTLWKGEAIAIELAYEKTNHHLFVQHVKCLEQPEGIIYRVERKGKVDFLAKWVRPDFETGKYLGQEVWNTSL